MRSQVLPLLVALACVAPCAASRADGLEYSIFMGMQYYGPPEPLSTYHRIVAAAQKLAPAPFYISACCDHNDTSGGAEDRHPGADPLDGGVIEPICDLDDAQGRGVRAGLDVLRQGGVKVLHYTHTRLTYWPNGTEYRCCECCEPLANVTARVEDEVQRFPGDGIFNDNVVAAANWGGYYRAIADAARRGNPSRPLGMNLNCAHGQADAGTQSCSPACMHYGHTPAQCASCNASQRCSHVPEELYRLADVHIVSETNAAKELRDPQSAYSTHFPFNASTPEHRNRMSMFTYSSNATEWRRLIDLAKAQGYTKFWVTGAPGYSRDGLPTFFEEMVDYIADMNA